jgi:di/tricarboxylate transporter
MKKKKKTKESGIKDLPDMTKNEKKNFLQNDLIERMIRLEKKVNAMFGKKVKYNETDFYKDLPREDKMRFNKYLNSRKKKSVGILAVLGLSLSVWGLTQLKITGNAMKEVSSVEPYWVGWIALGIFVVFAFYLYFNHLLRKTFEARLKKHEKDVIRRLKKSKK